ncbi:hypothetical protein PoB_001969200 [Plakobranchus ocellatus]|uniref:Uncharacterized protein n=1 Tax=Plakobranchus ocellatus TaxID=259542 RepID=A0AAV3ZF80_9GAST|nr:hypothetical protein PoB_001969200 [Plakobranchus ocellatus]
MVMMMTTMKCSTTTMTKIVSMMMMMMMMRRRRRRRRRRRGGEVGGERGGKRGGGGGGGEGEGERGGKRGGGGGGGKEGEEKKEDEKMMVKGSMMTVSQKINNQYKLEGISHVLKQEQTLVVGSYDTLTLAIQVFKHIEFCYLLSLRAWLLPPAQSASSLFPQYIVEQLELSIARC